MTDTADQVLAQFFNLTGDDLETIAAYVQQGQTLADIISGGGAPDLTDYSGDIISLEALTAVMGPSVVVKASAPNATAQLAATSPDGGNAVVYSLAGEVQLTAPGENGIIRIAASGDNGQILLLAVDFTAIDGSTEGVQIGTSSGSKVGFNATTPISRPEIPATPTAQDIADILVSYGLATQAV